ncbi:CBS domain-containing protein [Actinospica robiniae]|uniref:CBS domain-containing protein n=1 Tax=Actinospica robiniae TaxID=304901 RepID=UPI0003FFFDA2|nr:CBS domain-containing protein [Actinospica robiniae]
MGPSPNAAVIAALIGRKLSILELLAVWDARVRGHETNQRIAIDLDRHGLTTVPAFDVGPSDTLVEVVSLESLSASPTAEESVLTDEQEDPLSTPPQTRLKVSFLPSARAGMSSLSSQSTLEEALVHMLIGQKSEIAVIDEPSTLHGVVSYRGMGQAHAANKQQTLMNAMDCEPEVIGVNDDLLEVTPRILEHGYALVRDVDGSYCGIVTADDLARQFAVIAGPFFLVGEIERRLRRLLNKTYTKADFLALTNQKHSSADELMFDQYKQLISPAHRWQMLGWNLDKKLFLDHLDAVRKVRNQIMHFRPTPMTDTEHNHLKALRHMLLVLDPD